MQDLASGRLRSPVDAVDLVPRLDGEREMVQPRRVQLELLIDERLPKPERAGACLREPEVVDLLAPLALHEERRLEPERAEHSRVERE